MVEWVDLQHMQVAMLNFERYIGFLFCGNSAYVANWFMCLPEDAKKCKVYTLICDNVRTVSK